MSDITRQLAQGVAIRVALAYTPLPALLTHRNELTSPLSSWQRCKFLATSFSLPSTSSADLNRLN